MTSAQTIHDQLQSLLQELRNLTGRAGEILALANNGIGWEGITPEHKRKTDVIIAVVSQNYDIPPAVICSRGRRSHIVIARQVCMTLMRAKIGMTTYQVGKFLNRDHATVSHAEETVNNRIATDSKFAVHFARINIAVEQQLASVANTKAYAS